MKVYLINDFFIQAVGSGNSKKLAKAIAAQNMYQVISRG